eukprot:COSAG03_NODE_3999_length_1725_cov_95.299508_3_plen_64_part_00
MPGGVVPHRLVDHPAVVEERTDLIQRHTEREKARGLRRIHRNSETRAYTHIQGGCEGSEGGGK